MTRIEYAEYLYDLFMKETEGQLHPAKARFKELHDKGELPLPFIIRELRLIMKIIIGVTHIKVNIGKVRLRRQEQKQKDTCQY